jgi:sec-independent protein translocase protein TatB
MPTSLGPAEILVILIVALIVLGPDRLPKAARQLGKAVGEVRRWSSNVQDDLRGALDGTDDDDSFPQIAAVPDPIEPARPPASPSPARVVPTWVVPLPGHSSPPKVSPPEGPATDQ